LVPQDITKVITVDS
jgi:hypothetical protein